MLAFHLCWFKPCQITGKHVLLQHEFVPFLNLFLVELVMSQIHVNISGNVVTKDSRVLCSVSNPALTSYSLWICIYGSDIDLLFSLLCPTIELTILLPSLAYCLSICRLGCMLLLFWLKVTKTCVQERNKGRTVLCALPKTAGSALKSARCPRPTP